MTIKILIRNGNSIMPKFKNIINNTFKSLKEHFNLNLVKQNISSDHHIYQSFQDKTITTKLLLDFSKYAYGTGKEFNIGTWKQYEDSLNNSKYSQHGYHGIVFINENTKELVIASSGTNSGEHGIKDFISDLIKDYDCFLKRLPKTFLGEELEFARETITSIPNYDQYKVYFTGHSYGAVVAELSHFMLSKELGINSEAITFESPGTAPIINSIDPQVTFPLDNITIYNGMVNIINTNSQQSGRTFIVNSNQDPIKIDLHNICSTIKDFFNLTIKKHSLDAMLSSIDPQSEEFYFQREHSRWTTHSDIIKSSKDIFASLLNIKEKTSNVIKCVFNKDLNECIPSENIFGFKDLADTIHMHQETMKDTISIIGLDNIEHIDF